MRSEARDAQEHVAQQHDAPEHAAVAGHLRQLHRPAFGHPHALGEPHVTADGSRVVVTGSVFDDLVGVPRTALYTCRDGQLVPLTAAGGSARGGTFAPDGETLAFLSDRGTPGVFQLFLLASRGLGEAVATPPVPGTVEYAHWSPDGRRILLGVAGLGADLSGGQGSGTNLPSPAGAAPDWHPLVETDGGEDDDENAWRSLWLYTVATDSVTRLSPEGMNCWEAGWCGPDGVLTIASDRPGEDDWYGAALALLGTRNGTRNGAQDGTRHGTVRELLRSDVQLALPAGSPDGRYAAVVEAVCSDRWVAAGELVLVDVESGERTVAGTRHTDVTGLQWIDATRLGYVGQRHLDSVAGILDTAGGRSREVLSTERSCAGKGFYPAGAFSADGAVFTVQDSYGLPPQVVVTAPDGDTVLGSVAHTGTDYLRSVAGEAEAVGWTAPDGLEIEGILCTPPASQGGGPYPLVVNIHGGPVSAFRNSWSMGKDWVPLLVSRGYAVLCPNPRGSGGRGREFAGLVVGDMGGADTYDILSGVDALVARGVADPARIGLIGGSYGGFMSAWLVTQDQRFAAAVPVSPVTDWYSQSFTSNIAGWGNAFLGADPEQPGTRAHTRSPVLHASKATTPCLNVAGALDRCTPPGQAREFHQALRAHGTESALVIYPREGHGVRSHPAAGDFLARTVSWFEQHMPPTSSPREES